MGIADNIANNCRETCVYWGNPINDGEGGFTFDDPVEISCRWEGIYQVVSDKDGITMTSRAVVYVTQDVDEEGMLYFGTLSDLSSNEEDNPKLIAKAFIIKRFQKMPDLKGIGFLRKAFLTPSLSFGGF